MSISAVAPFPPTLTSLTQFTGSSSAQRSAQAGPSPAVSISISSIHPPIGSFNFKIDGENAATTIADAGEEYTATVQGLGTVSGSNEASVDAAINFRINELA